MKVYIVYDNLKEKICGVFLNEKDAKLTEDDINDDRMEYFAETQQHEVIE